MTTDPDVWFDRALAALDRADRAPRVERFGRVASVADGVARLTGLPEARLDELLVFPDGRTGFVHALEPEDISAVLFDGTAGIGAGDRVKGTGEVVRVPVGPGLLGRVVDPLGRPLDGSGPVAAETRLPIERPAPGIVERAPVTRPVQTGTLVLDALFALGRGQRELIVGDRATGKTTLALDTMLAQRDADIVPVYVAVGQKTAAVKRVVAALESAGMRERAIVVVAGPATAAGLQWIAPFAGTTMAEHFRDVGGDALIVLDDLTKHAACHREIALLTGQSPGREAYPGDVFYVHARLLERAAQLSAERGGGSLTALPVAETDAGNLSAYIPTNLISITDGQIVLDGRLFNAGQKPAVDVGNSVSRVGGKTQAASLRRAAESVRLDYAQFLELEIFTRFGGAPDDRVARILTRGARTRALLSQVQHRPYRLGEEVALLLSLQGGAFDDLPAERVGAAAEQFRAKLDAAVPGVAAACVAGPVQPDLRSAILDFAVRVSEQIRGPEAPS